MAENSARPEQMLKVARTSFFNARGSRGGKNGQVQISTGQKNGFVSSPSATNGCGHEPRVHGTAVVPRPFNHQEKRAWHRHCSQSKMIVEAHKGRMEVESEGRQGHQLRVMLPLKIMNWSPAPISRIPLSRLNVHL